MPIGGSIPVGPSGIDDVVVLPRDERRQPEDLLKSASDAWSTSEPSRAAMHWPLPVHARVEERPLVVVGPHVRRPEVLGSSSWLLYGSGISVCMRVALRLSRPAT